MCDVSGFATTNQNAVQSHMKDIWSLTVGNGEGKLRLSWFHFIFSLAAWPQKSGSVNSYTLLESCLLVSTLT